MNKIYTVTVTELDCKGNVGNNATWTFSSADDQQEFLSYIDTLAVEDNYEIMVDEYFCNTLDKAKKEVFNFINK